MGVFPIGRLYEVIDGRGTVAVHGPRDMLVWGDRFKEYNMEVTELSLKFGTPKDFEAFARRGGPSGLITLLNPIVPVADRLLCRGFRSNRF